MMRRVGVSARARSLQLVHWRTENWPGVGFEAGWHAVVAGTEVAMHLHNAAPPGDAPVSICGVITSKDVLRHGATIVREFGALAYLKCCAAILLRRRTTFLNCVCELKD